MAGAIRMAINGLGVMGRYLLRANEKEKLEGIVQRPIEIVAGNDIFTAEQLAPVVAHDSAYYGFPGNVEYKEGKVFINGKELMLFSEKDPSKLPWKDLGIDVVYESTGRFADEGADAHLKAGAKKVIISAPSKTAPVTMVMGVNDGLYTGQDIVSNASCTTNCLAPVVSVLYSINGQKPYKGLMTTIHAYTADQNLQDGPHKKDYPRGYAAALNMVPTSTGAAKAIGEVIRCLDKQLKGAAIRVPTVTCSLVDLSAILERDVTKEDLNAAFKAAAEGYLSGTLQYRDGPCPGIKGPLTSTMVLGCKIPSVFDAAQTQANGNLVKVFAWYDNVAGYSHQALRLARKIAP